MAERTSPLRSGYDFEVVSPQLTPEDIHREKFGDESGGGLVREAVKGLRRYADARTTNDLATRALDAQLEGNTAQADGLLQDRARRAAYSAPNAARVGRASDISGAGDFVDWFGSTVGEGLPSMGPALLGAAVGRGALGRVLGSKASAALGAAVPTYQDIHSSEVAGQFDDPVLAATPAEERARVARQTAALGTGLGVILPARLTGGFSKGGRELLKDIAVESATEGGENLISQYGRRQLDPTRDYDFVEAFDSAAAGGAVGAATGARVRTAQDAISSAKDTYANWSAGRGKPDGTPGGAPGGDPGGAPGGAPAAPSGLFDRVGESFSESGAVVRERAQSVAKSFEDAITGVVGPERAQAFRDRFNSAVDDVGGSISAMKDRLSEFADQEFGPEVADQIRATSEAMSKAGGDLSASASRFADAVKDRASEFDTTELRERMSTGVNKAKDAMSSGLDRMTEAMKTSKSPDEFLRKAFGSTIEEEAAADLDDNNLIGLRGATEAETAANIDRDDAARVERANRYARELMDDPATPDSVRERVASMQGDFSDPSNQKYLSRTLVAMRGGQKVAQAAADLVGLSKAALGAAKKAAGEAVSAVTDAVVKKKKNLQSASPAEQAAFNKVIFDNLTDEAKASTFVRAQLAQVTNVVMAFAAKTGDITAKDLPTLTKLGNAMSLFKDPDALASQLVEYGAIPRDSDSFLGRVKSIQNARTDIKKPNSFLYTSLTPKAMETFTGPMLQNLAQLVDEFSLQDAAGKGDEIVEGLSQAFGSPESALAVLDYYAQQNKANVRYDPNEGVRGADGEIDADELSSWSGSINERDAGKAVFRFKDAKSMRPFFKGSKDIDVARRDGTLGDESTQQPYSYAEYVKETGKDPEAEVRRLFKLVDGLIAEHKKHKKEDRSLLIKALEGQKSMMQGAYKNGGVEEALSLYEVLRTEAKDQNDLVATDEDLAKYSFKKGASRVTFKRTDGTKLMLSAESMWKTFGDNQKGETKGGSEGDTARARRLFKEAVASVLAREDIASLETELSGLVIDDNGTTAAPEINPVLRQKIADALNKASGSLAETEAALQDMLEGYSDALVLGEAGKKAGKKADEETDEETGEDAVYAFEEQLSTHIEQTKTAIGNATTAPQRAVLRQRLMAYKRALERMLETKQDFFRDDVGGNSNTDEVDPPVLSRVRKEMNTSKGERRVEEDTGAEIESGTRARGAPAIGTGKNVPPGKLEALLKAGGAVLRNGVYFITDADATKYLVGTDKHDRIYVNIGKLRESPNALVDYLSSSESKQKMLGLLGVSAEQLQEALGNTKRIASFLRDHERSHVENNDRGAYPKGGDGKLDLDHPTSIAIEARATYDALTESEREKLGITARPKAPAKPAPASKPTNTKEMNHVFGEVEPIYGEKRSERKPYEPNPIKFTDGKAEKNPAASSREAAKEVNDSQALSPDAFTALHDVVVKENYSRLDTPAKVLKFAAMAAKAREQLKKIPELERTDEQDDLRYKLNDMFDQSKGFAFDWESLWDGLDPTDAQKAQLEDLIRPKAEPGTARQSTMNPKRGRPGKTDRQAVIDEIIRTRGKDVKVAVDKLHSALGGSGQYTYNRGTGQRLIEVAINAIDPIGTARHEAMHDFFQFLGENEATRAVARTLKEVMGSKEVMDKLKDLLQGHKGALEQLNDPEERVAYAYQFWAAGALDLGPKSTGIFRTITNFLRDMFGIVTKEQRALDILNAFHDGGFSNVSTVREALFDQAERDGATFWEKMDRMAPALNRAVLAMSSAAPDRLRRFENDSLNALADKFFTDGGKQGFIQNRFQQEGVWSNKLEAAFAGSTAEERRIALEQLQSMKPVSPLAKKLAEFNSEMYGYMSAAGVKTFDRNQKKWVPIRRVNNYFARSWDGDAIARNRSDFVQLLMSEGDLPLGAAEEVAGKLINGREERLTPQEQSVLGFTPYAIHTAERVFGFIKPGNADEFAKFQKKDIADIMSNYVQQAVYRAEYARSFDNDGRVISDLIAASGITDKDELTAISNTVQAMEGSLDPGKWSSSTKELMSVMMTAQNVILLPLAIVSQVVDPIVLAARTGDLRDAGTAYVNGIKRLWNTVSKNGNKVDGEDLAYILGIVSEDSTLQAMGMTASTTRMSKRMEVINRKFFRYNGMQGWNNTMRITATVAAERYIIANKDNAEALAELGIAPGDVKMSTTYVPDGKGKLVAKHSLDVSSREVQQAMFKMVDQSVLRPSAANRPVWMSDPRFLLVGHLKQFTFAMHNVVLKRANKQLENGNAKPWLILALAAPAVLAADMAKFALTGGMPTSWGFFDYLSHAVNRSGLLGIGDFSTELFSGVGQGKLPGEGLLGPSFEHVAEILRWIGGDPRTGFEDVIDRTVPFAKYV